MYISLKSFAHYGRGKLAYMTLPMFHGTSSSAVPLTSGPALCTWRMRGPSLQWSSSKTICSMAVAQLFSPGCGATDDRVSSMLAGATQSSLLHWQKLLASSQCLLAVSC